MENQSVILDIRTLSFLTTFIAFIFGISLFVFGQAQKKFRGFPLFALAAESIAVGLMLLGYRDILSNFITIIVANALLIIAMVLYFEGCRRFIFTSTTIHSFSVMAIIIQVGTSVYFTYLYPSVNYRIISISITAMVISFLCARELFHDHTDYWRAPRIMLKFVFIGYGSYQLLRLFSTLGESTIISFMSAGNFHSLAFIFIIFLIIGTSFGFIWMVSKRLEFELTTLSEQDELCKIPNRRGVKVLVERELSRLRRIGGSVTVMLLDLDYLKHINDKFGHNIGDQAIRAFCEFIKKLLRNFDIFGRIGGDEFIIVLSQTSLKQSLVIAERIRTSVEDFIFELGGHKIKLTSSFGLATSNSKQIDFEEMTTRADKALYESKNQGRNKITHYSQMLKKA